MGKAEDRAWAQELAGLVERWPRVTLKKMMGSYALMAGDSMFGFPRRGGVSVKAPPELAERLVRAGQARPFEMNGRRMSGWYSMPGSTAAERKRLLAVLEAARDYVAANPTTKRKPARAKPQ
jgi:TfoX/Sxy family transcriptional regulator of competence genes